MGIVHYNSFGKLKMIRWAQDELRQVRGDIFAISYPGLFTKKFGCEQGEDEISSKAYSSHTLHAIFELQRRSRTNF